MDLKRPADQDLLDIISTLLERLPGSSQNDEGSLTSAGTSLPPVCGPLMMPGTKLGSKHGRRWKRVRSSAEISRAATARQLRRREQHFVTYVVRLSHPPKRMSGCEARRANQYFASERLRSCGSVL